MSAEKVGSRLRLVSQGHNTTTVLVGEVPVLELANFNDDLSVLVTTINFLRSGCPEVQWLVTDSGLVERPGIDDAIDVVLEEIDAAILRLQVNGREEFMTAIQRPVRVGSTITFRRRTPQADPPVSGKSRCDTVKVRFGELKIGEEFVGTEPGHIWMKMERNRDGYNVVMVKGPKKGMCGGLTDDMEVRKIVEE